MALRLGTRRRLVTGRLGSAGGGRRLGACIALFRRLRGERHPLLFVEQLQGGRANLVGLEAKLAEPLKDLRQILAEILLRVRRSDAEAIAAPTARCWMA